MYIFGMLLLSCSLASAVDWWVEDLDEAVEVTRALNAHWPDNDVHVLVGPKGSRGIWVDEGVLHLVDEGVTRDQPVSPDRVTQVLLVRSWTTELDTRDSGWVPEELVLDTPLPEAELADAERPALRVGVTGGPGLPLAGPPVRVAGELGVRSGRVAVAGVALADLYEELDDVYVGRRLGLGLQAGWYRPLPHGAVESALVAQTRWLSYRELTGDPVLQLVVPGATLRARWWGEPLEDVAVGIGLALTVEGHALLRDRAFRVGNTSVFVEPVTAQLEFHIARELRR